MMLVTMEGQQVQHKVEHVPTLKVKLKFMDLVNPFQKPAEYARLVHKYTDFKGDVITLTGGSGQIARVALFMGRNVLYVESSSGQWDGSLWRTP